MENDMLHDIDERAAKLFGVFEVTDAMRALVTVTRAVLSASHDGGPWAMCPNCRQSATGKYGRRYACARCHWNQGSIPAID